MPKNFHKIIGLTMFLSYICHASILEDMRHFDYRSIPGYSEKPDESRYMATENHDELAIYAKSHLQDNKSANELLLNAKQRPRISEHENREMLEPGKHVVETSQASSIEDDAIKNEESQDFGDGVSHLGALFSGSNEVLTQSSQNKNPMIFSGVAVTCKKYPIGLKDCCTGSGFGGWILHCPKDLQALLKAKNENRTVYLGSYKKHKIGGHHHVFCVFPTKLAGIFQIQGRYKQLGIGFGDPKNPYCNGITPEQFSKLDFGHIDLSDVEQDFVSQFKKPSIPEIHPKAPNAEVDL